MKTSTAKLTATAAGIILVLAAAVVFLTWGPGRSQVAWAQLPERLETTSSVAYHITMEMTGMPGMPADKTIIAECDILQSAQHGMYMEMRTEGKIASQMYVSFANEEMITFMSEQKKYLRMTLTPDLIEKAQSQSKDPKQMVSEMIKYGYTEIGHDTIEGVEVVGIEVTDPRASGGVLDEYVGRLWVSAETDLPVLMTMEGTANEGQMAMHGVLDGFRWDVETSPADFAPEIPDDYTLFAEMEIPEPSEEGLINALATFAQTTKGRYPSKLDPMTLARELGEALAKEALDPNNEQGPEKMSETSMAITMGVMYYMQLVQEDRDPAYYGDTVTAEDPDALLLRWRLDDGSYRVIYADLTADTVTADQLAEIEAHQPIRESLNQNRPSLYDEMAELSARADELRAQAAEASALSDRIHVLEPNEGTLIQGLAAFADTADNRYPSELDLTAVIQELAQVFVKKYPDINSEQTQQKLREISSPVTTGTMYYMQLVQEDRDPAYYGETVTANDPDALLLRWRLDDGSYRVIYGDLHADTITADQLATLENQQP